MVTELLHEEKLTGVKVKNVHTGEEDTIPCDGVFISVGRKPATELVQGQLELDRSGYIIADETTATNLPRRVRRGRCADEAPAPGSHSGSRRSHGSPHGGGVPGRRRVT